MQAFPIGNLYSAVLSCVACSVVLVGTRFQNFVFSSFIFMYVLITSIYGYRVMPCWVVYGRCSCAVADVLLMLIAVDITMLFIYVC